jgi:predicted O-methyltransferase YrrM
MTDPSPPVDDRVVVNTRRAKFDTGDVFALEALRPLAPQFVPWTSFSLRPSALLTAVNEIHFRRPRLVVECGAGASTLYLARILAQTGGRLVAVDSDPAWATYAQRMVRDEGLAETAHIVHAPLVPWARPAQAQPTADHELPDSWYDEAVLRAAIGADPIDLLLVDGPPGGRQLSRYPAVPVLRDLLAADAVVMLDDARRAAEAEAVRLWAAELDCRFVIYQRMSLAIGRRTRSYSLLGT